MMRRLNDVSTFTTVMDRRRVLAGLAGFGVLAAGLMSVPGGRALAQDDATPVPSKLGPVPNGGVDASGKW